MEPQRNENNARSARMRPEQLQQQPQQHQAPPAQQAPNAQNAEHQQQVNPGRWISTYLGFLPSQHNLKYVQDNRILFISSKTEVVHPQDESYLDMLKINAYSLWNLCSLTTVLLATQIVVFIVSQGLGHESSSFLEVNIPTLTNLGMNQARLVYQGEVYRLLTSLFLHLNVSHLLANMYLAVYLLPCFQYTFGWIRTFITLLSTGITANIFSNIISPDADQSMLKAGSTNFIYGFIGLGLGYIALNWSALEIIGPVFKFRMFVTLIFSVLFLIVFGDQAVVRDYSGHLGGFLAGFFFAGFMPTFQQSTQKTIARGVFASLFVIMCVGVFLFFYFLPQGSYSS